MHSPAKVAVRQGSNLFYERSQAVARLLGLPCLEQDDADFWLECTDAGLVLCRHDDRKGIVLDWTGGAMDYRRRQSGAELLVKAFGNLAKGASILDATSGFATDSVILSLAGFKVTACERHPVVHALQRDAYERAQCDAGLRAALQRLQLIAADAREVLHAQTFDAVYLDPMFPERSKSAAVKKPMVYLQALLGEGDDGAALLEQALRVARQRVVVKRPLKAPFLAGIKPAGQKLGKAVRFDMYSPQAV
ncbi:MAG TPA: class I SAM-dependent methyltransferase [Pseudomonadales bacterium]